MSYAPTQSPMTARSTSSSDMSSLQVPNIQRHRKTVSTGGGRAWSDAEEAYLIETREHKMPYKHIAAQLKKTELACRLHYHQLSFGSKSRRTPSLASIHSMRSDRSSMTPPSASSSSLLRQPTPQRPLPSFSPPESPPNDQSTSTPTSTTISHTSDPTPLTSSKPILPRPNIPSQGPYQHHHHQQHRSAPSTSSSTSSPKRLRLNTSPRGQQNHYVDLALLNRLYDSHRLHFWSTIASAYGTGLSPATLEDAWRASQNLRSTPTTTTTNDNNHSNNGNSSALPPTPRGSPAGETPVATTGGTQHGVVQEGCYSAVTDPGRCCPPSSATSSTAAAGGGFTAVNSGWTGSSRASEPPPPVPQQQRQQQQQQQQEVPRSSSAYANANANGAGRRGVVGSIRSLLNGGEEGGSAVTEEEQGRRLREIEREYGDVVRRSASASASEGSTPATGQMEGVAGAAARGPQAVETTA